MVSIGFVLTKSELQGALDDKMKIARSLKNGIDRFCSHEKRTMLAKNKVFALSGVQFWAKNEICHAAKFGLLDRVLGMQLLAKKEW